MNHSILLRGLDGSNPLAFLAALGTLRTLGRAMPGEAIRMAWAVEEGAWRPRLFGFRPMDEQGIIDALHRELACMAGHAAFTVDKDLKIEAGAYRRFLELARYEYLELGDARAAEFGAAFGCDALHDKGIILDTAFRTMGGAGHQHFLQFMNDLAKDTQQGHLEKALFRPWVYDDPPPGMRWDPEDDRRYALRWKNPSHDKIKTVRGANRLAVEALPLFPACPVSGKLVTTAFKGKGMYDTFFTWPIWTAPISLDAVRSVLSLEALQHESVDRAWLAAVGVAEAFRSQRITIGKFRNFTPARPV